MELLLHYVWQHQLLPPGTLCATDGRAVEVIDAGLHNLNSGPDFFNDKIKIDGMLWVGNVEIHKLASDWHRHSHDDDDAYNNVILHVCERVDADIRTPDGRLLPQLEISVPQYVSDNYRELLLADTYPPCYRIIPKLADLMIHSWLNALTIERLQQKTERIERYLSLANGDWEYAFFIALARGMGFGVNSDAFERWAFSVPLNQVGHHRDDAMQVEAFFFGQAGLLDDHAVKPEQKDDYFCRLQQEYHFLKHKFHLTPIDSSSWRFLRMRPQNFPTIRMAQLVNLFVSRRLTFRKIVETKDVRHLRKLFDTGVTDYWETHYTFGRMGEKKTKTLQKKSIDLLLVNVVAPVLFAYGRETMDDAICERAFSLLESLPAENDNITRHWQHAGLEVDSAADSQALIQLRTLYCDRKDCIHCRIGRIYLKECSIK